MSFRPIDGGFSQSLLGASDPVRFSDVNRQDVNEIYARRIHGSAPTPPSLIYTFLIILASAFIFVTIVSIFDVFRNGINIQYARQALNEPSSGNTPQQIANTEIANNYGLASSATFAVFCIIVAIPMVWIISTVLIKNR